MNTRRPASTISACDARNRLGELLGRVERDEQIARLLLEARPDLAAAHAALDRLIARADSMAARDGAFTHEELIDWRDEGRRRLDQPWRRSALQRDAHDEIALHALREAIGRRQ